MATVMATTPIRKTTSELNNESPLPTPPRAMHDLIRNGRNSRPSLHIDDLDTITGPSDHDHYLPPLTESHVYTVESKRQDGLNQSTVLGHRHRPPKMDSEESSSPSTRSATTESQRQNKALSATIGTLSSSSLLGVNTGRASPISLAASMGAQRGMGGLGSQMGIHDEIANAKGSADGIRSSTRPALVTSNRSSSYESSQAKSSTDARLTSRSSLRGMRNTGLKDKENIENASLVTAKPPTNGARSYQSSTHLREENKASLAARMSSNALKNGRSPSPTAVATERSSQKPSTAFHRSSYRRSSAEQDDLSKPASIATNENADVIRRISDEGVPSTSIRRTAAPEEMQPLPVYQNQNQYEHSANERGMNASKETASSFQTPGLTSSSRALRSGQTGGSRPTAAPWSVGRSIKRMDRHSGLDKPPQRIVAPQIEQEEDEEEEEEGKRIDDEHDREFKAPSPIQEESSRLENYQRHHESGVGRRSISHSNEAQTHIDSDRYGQEASNKSDGSGGSSGGRHAMLRVPLGADEDDEEEELYQDVQKNIPSRQATSQEAASRRGVRGIGSFSTNASELPFHKKKTAMNDIMSAKVPSATDMASAPRRVVVQSIESGPAPMQSGLGVMNGHVDISRGLAAAPPTPRSISDFMTLVREEALRQANAPFIEQLSAKPSKDLETKFNGYKFKKIRKAGEGGFSTVWVVRGPYAAPDPLNPGAYIDVAEGDQAYFAMKQVTLKKMEQVSREEVLEECNLLQTLASKRNNEDFILRFFGWKSSTGSLKILLELGEHDFNQILRAQCLSHAQIVRYWYQMLQAVHFTHEEGNIVHTDLKPANFLMANGRLKLIDFGIAQKIPVGTIHIKRDAMIGTPNYMAPETVRAVKEGRNGRTPNPALSGQAGNSASRVYKAGKASDIWAMGCILYQMVYNRPPFEAFHGDDKLREILDPNHKIDFSSVRYGPKISEPRQINGQRNSENNDEEDDDETELEPVDQDLIDVMRLTLTYSALERVTIPQLLRHPLLQPLEEERKYQQARMSAGNTAWLDEDANQDDLDDEVTVPMSRTMLRDVLRKMYAFARSGELNEENLDARTDALFDNMVLRKRQME